MLTIAAVTFAAIFLVELPDKTFFATLILATRYRPLYAWIGVSLAFAVQTLVAVALGEAVSQLPRHWVHVGAGVMFLIGALWLLREGLSARAGTDDESADGFADKAAPVAGWRQIGASFLILFAAEWGDLSQILTAVFVSRYHESVPVFLGALGALVTVSGLAVLLGGQLMKILRMHVLHFIGAGVCLTLGLWTLIDTLA